MKVGVAISCHNRNEMAIETINKWKNIIPKDFKLVIVDDASLIPIPNSDFRFEKNAGIAKVKNKCLELLDDCDHIFLSDDDVYPIVDDWYSRYINSGKKHLMFTFNTHKNGDTNGHRLLKTENGFSEFSHPCGCLLYIHRSILDIVGGFDEKYGRYSHEHVDFSNRVFNNKLTNVKYEDVAESTKLFYSLDWSKEVSSSVKNKKVHIQVNNKRLNNNRKSKAFMPYKTLKTAIVTTYFTGVADTQRGTKWNADIESILPLIKSMKGQKLVILHDCFNSLDFPDVEFVKVKTTENPYFQRWISISEYLKSTDYDYIFCVDATDVVMLNNPFNDISKGKIYTGDEKQIVASKWIRENHNAQIKDKAYHDFYFSHRGRQLLNAGILGGSKQIIIDFVDSINKYYLDNNKELGLTDMATFNFIAYTRFSNVIKHGSKINTVFKAFDTKNTTAFFRHK